jgi:hypothetical protein
MWGGIYGTAVFIVMNFVVLPHTAAAKSLLPLPLLLNGVLGHALFVGLGEFKTTSFLVSQPGGTPRPWLDRAGRAGISSTNRRNLKR